MSPIGSVGRSVRGRRLVDAIPDSAELHLDATKLDLNDGENVETWPDETDNGNDFTGTGPTFIQDGINGNPSVVYDGTDDRHTRDSAVLPGSTNRTVFVVTEQFNSQDRPSPWSDGFNVDLGDSHRGGVFAITNEYAVRVNGGNRVFDEGIALDTGEISTYIFDGTDATDISARRNGAGLGVSSESSQEIEVENNRSTLGQYFNGEYYDGQIGEILVCDEALTTAEIEEQEERLSEKWSITL